jgi:hypothetical protein
MRVDKNQDGLFYWTKHSQGKLRQYGLSASRIKRLIRHPERIEAGIAPETWASMQTAGSKKHPYEIWTMYVIEKMKDQKSCLRRQAIRIISAWKYPGKTNPGDPIPIPPDIFEEIMISLAKTSSKTK